MTKIRMMTATLALFAVAATANAEQTLRFGTDNMPVQAFSATSWSLLQTEKLTLKFLVITN